MNDGKISVRYARALYHAACEQGCEREVYVAMRQFVDSVSGHLLQFEDILKNPTIGNSDKAKLIETAIGNAIPQCLKDFINLVIKHNREGKMYLIALKYQEQYRRDKNIMFTRITTATELPEVTLKRIKDFVAENFHTEVEAQVDIDPKLIGGFTLDIENNRMDASVVGRLNALKNRLKQ